VNEDRADSGTRVERVAKRSISIVLLLLGTAILLAACGSGSSSPATQSASQNARTAPSNAQTSFNAYSACMKKHGVNFGGFKPGSSGGNTLGGGFGAGPASSGFRNQFNQPAFKKASAACANLRPKFSRRGTGSANSTAFATYRNCLSLHGMKLPSRFSSSTSKSPSSIPNSPSVTSPSGLTASSPAAKAALAACGSLRPTFPGTGPPTTGGSTGKS
jgi:hypothetical protein